MMRSGIGYHAMTMLDRYSCSTYEALVIDAYRIERARAIPHRYMWRRHGGMTMDPGMAGMSSHYAHMHGTEGICQRR